MSKTILKTLALSELRRVAERTRRRVVPAGEPSAGRNDGGHRTLAAAVANSTLSTLHSPLTEVIERIPWRVWYVAASNGDCIRGEECVTLAVYTGDASPGAYPSRLVMFTASGQTRRLRDCCILRADDFLLRV